jgi:soluble lytic murein transglycosylase
MTTPSCSDRSTPVRWSELPLGILTVCLLGLFPLSGQTLETLARQYQKSPTAAHHSALLRFAAAHPRDSQGALALLSLGVTESRLGVAKHPDAVQHLKAAKGRLPKLADYIGYQLAAAESDLKQFSAVRSDLIPVWNNSPPSQLSAKAALLAASADVETGNPTAGVELLRRYYSQLPQPDGDLALATSYEAAHDLVSAAVYYQRVYYQYPASQEAGTATTALGRLREALGASYPPSTAAMMLERAGKLIEANLHSRARQEYQSLVSQLAGSDRDAALVGIGVARYAAGDTRAAYQYLKSLQVSSPEADAQRLYYLGACARRMDNDSEMDTFTTQLGQLYPNSKWHLKALISAGNSYLLTNQAERYVPLFRAAYEAFPSDPLADYCHWKTTWNAYLSRRSEAAELLREHLVRFPTSSYSAAALYFLGRLSEGNQDFAAAKAFYEKIVRTFPSYYYGSLAEEALRKPVVSRAVPSQTVAGLLSGIALRTPSAPGTFEPTGITSLRIERARLLASAALDDLAEDELRFGAAAGDQPHVLAMELAQMAAKQGAPDRAIRFIKRLVPDYFAADLDSMPRQFWELAFPLPYRSSLVRYARERSLDPYLVAGLVRQESEFNSKAVSPAKAYGLTQILPSTGRHLSRKIGVRRFRTSLLLQPDINLRLGTYYLRSLLDGNGGKLVESLAAYNAGATRVASWTTWGDFREPAEFVETIPISETRNYVQSVLRNTFAYRRLYGPEPPAVASSQGASTKTSSTRKSAGTGKKSTRRTKR